MTSQHHPRYAPLLGVPGLLLLVACTLGSPPGPAPAGTPSSAGGIVETTITALDLKFDPANVRFVVGQPVRVAFVNKGAIEHDWEANGLVARDVQVVTMPNGLSQAMRADTTAKSARGVPHLAAGPNQQMVMTFTSTQTGIFTVACLVPGRRRRDHCRVQTRSAG